MFDGSKQIVFQDELVFSVCHKYRPEAKQQWLAPVLLGMGCRL